MRFVPNFKILGQVVNEKYLTKFSIFIIIYYGVRDRKKKNRKKCKKNLRTLGLFSVINLVILILYTKYEDFSTSKC